MVNAARGHHALSVDVDRLDAIAVRIEQEGSVVGRAILRAQPGRAVIASPCVDARPPKRIDRRAVPGAEADV